MFARNPDGIQSGRTCKPVFFFFMLKVLMEDFKNRIHRVAYRDKDALIKHVLYLTGYTIWCKGNWKGGRVPVEEDLAAESSELMW